MALVINATAVTPAAGAVAQGAVIGGSGSAAGAARYQVQPPIASPNFQVFNGAACTPWIDMAGATNITAQIDIKRTIPQGTLAALANSAAGSFQAEYSIDGNGGIVQGSPAAIAQNKEQSFSLTASTKQARYVRYRFVPTSAVTVEGALLTLSTAPIGTVQTSAFTVDGLGYVLGTGSSTYLYGYPYTNSTTPLGTQTTGTALSAAPNQVRFCPAALGTTTGANQYYLACAVGATLVIQPFTAPAMTFGTATVASNITPTVAKTVAWHPGIVNPRACVITAGGGVSTGVPVSAGFFIAVAGTGGITIFAFNPANGQLGAVQTLSTLPNVGNITSIEFSPDGNWLLVGGATTTYLTVLPVQVLLNAQGVYSLNLGVAIQKPTILPNAAILSVKWHPEGDMIFYTTGTSTYLFGQQFWANSAGAAIPGSASGANQQTAIFGGPIACPTPAAAPVAFPDNISISPDGAWIGLCIAVATYFHACYSIGDPVTGVGAAATVVAPSAGTTTLNTICWHPNGQSLYAGGATSLFQGVWPWLVGVDIGITVQGNNLT